MRDYFLRIIIKFSPRFEFSLQIQLLFVNFNNMDNEDLSCLRCHVVSSHKLLPTFQIIILPTPSELISPRVFLDNWTVGRSQWHGHLSAACVVR
jgi:hypothetical protein